MKRFLLFTLIFLASKVNSQTIATIAGIGVAGFSGDHGPAIAAKIDYATSIIADPLGNLLFADINNNCIRKISITGIITTIAGSPSGVSGFYGDGGPASVSLLYHPQDLAFDDAGNLYIADGGNQRVRKINTAGIISTFAGTGTAGFSGDGLAATSAKFWCPFYVCTDHYGNVYVSDNQNQRVRKINAAGIVTTVVGNGVAGDSGDGSTGPFAEISYPGGIKVDVAKSLYIAEYSNRIRKIDSFGVVSTIIGSGAAGFSGDDGPGAIALLHQPIGLIFDPLGNIIFNDVQNHRVRKVDASTGIITTIAGDGTAGYSGDGMNATAAELNFPPGLCLDIHGNLIIADGQNFRIRKVGNNHRPIFAGSNTQSISFCEGESGVSIDTLLSVIDSDAGQTETWSVAQNPLHGTLSVVWSITSTGGLLTPAGTTYTPFAGYIGNDSFKVNVSDGQAIDTTTVYVTINPTTSLPAIVGPDTVCYPGAPATIYTDAISGGVWTVSNAHAVISSLGELVGISSGIDTVVYSYSSSCGSVSASRTIYLTSLVSLASITGPDAVCIGSTITLIESVPGGTWGHANSHSLVNTSGVDVGVSAGLDTVTYSTTNFCGTSKKTHVVEVYTPWQCDSALAVGNIGSGVTGVRVMPNPALTTIHLEWSQRSITMIELLNAVGQTVWTGAVDASSADVDVATLVPGIYLVRIAQNGEMQYTKFLKI